MCNTSKKSVSLLSSSILKRNLTHGTLQQCWPIKTFQCFDMTQITELFNWISLLIKKKHWFHDDIIKWKHFLHYWPFVWGIHWSPVTGEFPSQRPVTQALMSSLICTWTKGRVKNQDAGDLRQHHAHYDVTVMPGDGLMPSYRFHFLTKWWTTKSMMLYENVRLQSVKKFLHFAFKAWILY